MKKLRALLVVTLVTLSAALASCAAIDNRGVAAAPGVTFRVVTRAGVDQPELHADLAGNDVPVGARVWLDGNRVIAVQKTLMQGTRQPAISLATDEAGRRKLAQLTSENMGGAMAILAPDGRVLFSGPITNAILNGSLLIKVANRAEQNQVYDLLTATPASTNE